MAYMILSLLSTLNIMHSQLVNCNGGTCNCPASTVGETCILLCDRFDICKEQTLHCRPGDACEIRCSAKSSCSAGTTINAQHSTDVTVICSAEDSCKDSIDITCGTGQCRLDCTHNTACIDWGDISTSLSSSFQCNGDCPSGLPLQFTEIPTLNPTFIPTFLPTNYPTNMPTNIPTLLPTIEPTLFPTVNPTNVPTDTPTNIATNVPTNMPTNTPTFEVINAYTTKELDSDELNMERTNSDITLSSSPFVVTVTVIGIFCLVCAVLCWIYSVKANRIRAIEMEQKRNKIDIENNLENNNDFENDECDEFDKLSVNDSKIMNDTNLNVNNGEIISNEFCNYTVNKEWSNNDIPPPPPLPPLATPHTPQTHAMDVYKYLQLMQRQYPYYYYNQMQTAQAYAVPYYSSHTNTIVNKHNNVRAPALNSNHETDLTSITPVSYDDEMRLDNIKYNSSNPMNSPQ